MSTATGCPISGNGRHDFLSDWSPLGPESVADPYPAYALARREAPVFYSNFFDAWLVTSYADVLRVVNDPGTFSSRKAMGKAEVPSEVKDLLPNGYPWAAKGLGTSDPPFHTRIRKLSAQAFKPQIVAGYEPIVRRVVSELIDDLAPLGRAEFMSSFANLMPGYVLCEILGVPREMNDTVVRWADEMVLTLDPSLPHGQLVETAKGQADWYNWVESFIDERRATPGDDLMSRLIEARTEDEAALTQRELISAFCQILLGGNETVRKLLGTMLLCLLEHPEQLEAVKTDRRLVAAAVDETLRYNTSVRGLFRITTTDVDLGGVTIPEDALVVVMWASANRDETKFDHAEEFDIHRPDLAKHVAFSRGPHFCIGQPLALMELRISLDELLTRLPNVRRADDAAPDWQPLVLHGGLHALELEWDVDEPEQRDG